MGRLAELEAKLVRCSADAKHRQGVLEGQISIMKEVEPLLKERKEMYEKLKDLKGYMGNLTPAQIPYQKYQEICELLARWRGSE